MYREWNEKLGVGSERTWFCANQDHGSGAVEETCAGNSSHEGFQGSIYQSCIGLDLALTLLIYHKEMSFPSVLLPSRWSTQAVMQRSPSGN